MLESQSNDEAAAQKPPHDPYYCLHKNLELRSNRLGKGLYAKAPIKAGSVIYNPAGATTIAKVSSKEMAKWNPRQLGFFEKYAWQVGSDLWCGPSSKQDLKNDYVNFLNHSCEPSTWFEGDEILVARRDIDTDEEITFDYATCDTNVSTFLVQGCLCGAKTCRKRISPWDYRLPSLQSAYGEHFMGYVVEKIKREPLLEFGTGMYSGLHKNIELRESPCGGCGLFAKELIPKGSIVWCGEFDDDEVADWETVKNFSEEKKAWFLNYCYQVEDDKVSSIRSPDDLQRDAGHYMNHSCDPTAWFIGDRLMEARRDIQPGEEVTYDYGTADSLFERITECRCGTAKCRQRVTPKDYLIPELQARYKHHFALHILAKTYIIWDMQNEAPHEGS